MLSPRLVRCLIPPTPPLRYVVLAALYWLPVDPQYITNLFGVFVSFVFVPVGFWIYARTIASAEVGVLAAIGAITARIVGYGNVSYYMGSWQYDQAIFFLFLTLGVGHLAVHYRDRRHYMLAGVFLGVLGLTQLTLATFGVFVISMTYLWLRSWRGLLTTGAIGAVFLIPLILTGGKDRSHIKAQVAKRTPDAIAVSTGELLQVGAALTLFQLVALIILYNYSSLEAREYPILSVSVGVFAVIWLVSAATTISYFGTIVYLFGPLLVALALLLLIESLARSVAQDILGGIDHRLLLAGVALVGIVLALALPIAIQSNVSFDSTYRFLNASS